MTDRHVVVIGGANIDIKWRAHHRIYSGSSSTAEKSEHFGGVARNIAEGLARMGEKPIFISCVGQDDQGRHMINYLRNLSVDTKYVAYSSMFPTANYCAFFHPSGDLYTALVDLRIYDECSVQFFSDILPELAVNNFVVLDTDLPELSLRYLLSHMNAKRWLSVTCVPAVEKIRPVLSYIDMLFLNHQEFDALCPLLSCFEKKCAWLHEQGVKSVAITRGSGGVLFCDERLNIMHLSAVPTNVVDVTGAGDALVAGSLFAYLQGHTLQESLMLGTKAASLTIQSTDSVSPFLRELIYEKSYPLPSTRAGFNSPKKTAGGA